MKLLLDTHVLLWSVLKPDRLSATVRRALEDSRNELWISPISIWEALLLLEHGRVKISAKLDQATWLLHALDAIGLREASINRQVALATTHIVLEHQDPADRFLAATAAVYELTLVTADEKLLRGKGFRTLANA